MSIKSTSYIKRDDAISRIQKIYNIIEEKKYKDLESITFEEDYNLANFVDNFSLFNISNIDKWTNKMLSDKIDDPFFRYSMFDNYIVID